jgi:hypothetical protein
MKDQPPNRRVLVKTLCYTKLNHYTKLNQMKDQPPNRRVLVKTFQESKYKMTQHTIKFNAKVD